MDKLFQKAVPIWATGRAYEMNCELAFRAAIADADAILYLAASSVYRVWVNGNFVCAGPARAAHGFYRVDEIDLTPQLCTGQNTVVIEVTAFNVNSYDTLDQPGFLTAEILQSHEVTAATGDDSFGVYDLHQRIQRVQRYSFQRAFAEAYRLRTCRQVFYLGGDGGEQLEAEMQAEKRYLRRETPMPQFEPLQVQRMIQTGKVSFDIPCETLWKDRAYTQIGPLLKGYPADDLEEHLSDEAQTFVWEPSCGTAEDVSQIALENGYAICRFPYNATGFLCMTVECVQACTVYLLFDEILTNGDVDFLRLTNCNCFKYDLDAGTHRIMTFAPYTMMYLKIAAKGTCRVSEVRMLQYQHPAPEFQIRLPAQKQLREIAAAAVRTYRQNALDLFMDCPSRERAGWLCDSFFTARTEYMLTGQCAVEKAFLENFLLAEQFACLPDGMLPMCYPADHYDGNFIPNWAMWFVLELDEYIRRSGDCTFAERAKPRVYGLIQYFASFENEYGLLEKLEKWVFVEWSRANDPDVGQDINFPTNMLYARMLQIAGALYSDPVLLEKSQKLHETIRQRSFNGSFFTDNERRTEQGLVNPGNITEVCQYYAFFMGTADKQTYPELWQMLVRDFGPHRAADCYPDVAAANAFIGDYLRLELLYLDGQTEKLLQDLKEYFTPMAERTGTLWEHNQPSASCCHGFAAHVLYWLAKIYGTEKTQYAGA